MIQKPTGKMTCCTIILVLSGHGLLFGQDAGPALSIDAAADHHPISPYIYGMAYPDEALAREIRLPLNRWGGDATTRYNWQVDATNAGDDWFFMAGGTDQPLPSGGPDKLITGAKSYGGQALLSVPIIDYVNKSTATDCSFPVSLFGKQQKVNPYVHPVVNGKQTDAGNGRTPDGKPIGLTKEQILRIHLLNTPELQRGWIKHLVKKFGTAARGGVPMYELDNEPGGWANTHRDVHPSETGHDELVSRSIVYAATIKSIDPSALVLGPGDFVMHYQSDGKPGDGKKEHGGLGQGDYYLRQMCAYENKHSARLLDYFDEHYYPIEQEGQNEDTIIEATRSLWDPSYKEKNWVGKWIGAKEIIPKFHRWVDNEYPGTKVSISEYGWGDMTRLNDTLALADVLGIFGRERLGLACMFGPPKASDAGANAFRIFRNYDGKGARYGETWVRSVSADQGRLSVYAAVRSADDALTVVVINKTAAALSSEVNFAGISRAGDAQVFRFSADNLKAVVRQANQTVEKTGFKAVFPGKSITLFAIQRG